MPAAPSMAQLIADLSKLQRLVEDQEPIPIDMIDTIEKAKQLAVAIELLGVSLYPKKEEI